MEILLMMVVLGLLMYFMMIRPQQKRMKDQRNMLDQLTPGTKVLLISRVFGTIRATGDTQFVIELAPGVEITCMKEAIMRVATEADEEFVFTDDAVEADAEVAAPIADQLAESDFAPAQPEDVVLEGTVEPAEKADDENRA